MASTTPTPLSMDLNSLKQVISKLSLLELNSCFKHVEKTLNARRKTADLLLPEDYLEVHQDFVVKDSVSHESILAELESLQFKSSKRDKCVTKWLTSTGEGYSWSSSSGQPIVKEPIDITRYPGINALMQDINQKFGVDLNSCLASYYDNGVSATRYHADDESSLDQSQGLFVVSFGAERRIDLKPMESDKRFKTDFFIRTEDCSLYQMKPGCQQYFVHRVAQEKSVKGSRYSLSFRRLIPSVKLESSSTSQPSRPSSSPPPPPPALPVNQPSPSPSPDPILYYRTSPRKPRIRKSTVLFGTSMTKRVNVKNLGFKGRSVINVSKGGAIIKDVLDNVMQFYDNDSAARKDDIEKVIFSIGTNDILNSRQGVNHLKRYLIELVETTKSLFPHAVIIFQSCLPIRSFGHEVAHNVLAFNFLLKDLTKVYANCVYMDCFKDFLTPDFRFCNDKLYHDWIHLNKYGIHVLSTWLKLVVNENSYDRIIDNLFGLKLN